MSTVKMLTISNLSLQIIPGKIITKGLKG